tara:strand:+ start:16506 stop:16721 length:216 start_codon:yes stop_codon:yes gene_type:complete
MVNVNVKIEDPEKRKMVESLLVMLKTDDFQDSFLDELNDAVDIPFIGEKKEGKVFKALYKILIKVVEKKML